MITYVNEVKIEIETQINIMKITIFYQNLWEEIMKISILHH